MKTKLIAAFKTWLVIYPSLTALLFLFGPQLSAMPLYLRTLALTAFLVPWLMFVGIPALNGAINQIIKVFKHGKS